MIALPLLSAPISADNEAGLGCLTTPHGNLPLTAVDIDAQITGLLHTTRIRQTFVNPHDEPVETTYIFPLPDRAAVAAFRMQVGDRVVEGLIQERSAARREYEQAVSDGRRAAIAEEERPNIFTVRVGNLVRGDRATIELTLTGPLTLDEGEATWRFPLVVAPRYIPDAQLPGESVGDGVEPDTDAVPDASRITPPVLLPGFPNPVALTIRVALDAVGLPVAVIRSSLPADIDGTVITIRPGQRLDRDLIVRFDVGAETIASSLVVHDGTFALTLVPPAQRVPVAVPHDVVFVLDRSGSMQGWKMIAARRAVARMIDTLGAVDRFGVLAFDDRIEQPTTLDSGLVPATDRHRFRAVEFLASLQARGGTEMLAPLSHGMSALAGGELDLRRERVLVLVTDGQAGNEDQILADIAAQAGDVRIFTVGIDAAVNDAFLRRLAAVGGGSCEVVESEDRLDEVMDRIHRRISSPVLTAVAVTGTGLDIEAASLAPQKLPALHAGAPLLVFGRFGGDAVGGIRVTARDAAGAPWSIEVPVTAGGSSALTAAWARAHIRDLEDRYVVAGGDDAIEQEIVRTSLDAHVLSRFTAFVAVDAVVVVEGGRPRKVTQPVEMPYGWDMRQPVAMTSMVPLMAAAPGAPMPTSVAYGQAGSAALPPSPRRLKLGRSAARPAQRDREAAELTKARLDLAPYRRRAAKLAEQVIGEHLAARELQVALTDLVDDLRSVGATGADIDGLTALLTSLRDSTWGGDVLALQVFAGTVPAPSKAFWKR